MHKVGDIITWNTKGGRLSGEVIKVEARYTVLIEPDRKRHMLITEVEIQKQDNHD